MIFSPASSKPNVVEECIGGVAVLVVAKEDIDQGIIVRIAEREIICNTIRKGTSEVPVFRYMSKVFAPLSATIQMLYCVGAEVDED